MGTKLECTEARTPDEVRGAEQEMLDSVWYVRHQELVEEAFEEGICPDCAGLREGEDKARVIEAKCGIDECGQCGCDFCQGILNGKLSALRWILGEEWDALDN